ncbi:alpha/beta fold hydrolase [Halalkalibacterium halodurans]|uniref:alpha/beta fold hydrolase n=1 Tax=Halalkalibacterium halodurans TaxID=86665 RepID=UPI0038B3EC61
MKTSAKMITHAHPNSTGIIIPSVGHGIPLAKPDQFNQLVDQWLKEERLPHNVRLIEE